LSPVSVDSERWAANESRREEMALIRGFERFTKDQSRIHRTEVTCYYADFERGGRRFLQLETRGSDDRMFEGKVSLQLDADGASELVRIARTAFPELG
jgi:hypothetical protein